MDIFYQYLSVVLVLSILFGIFAQTSQFCLLGGLRSFYNKQSAHRLMAYFVALVTALLGATLIEFYELVDLNTTKPPYRSANFVYGRYILGGFIFGTGMVLSNGCGMRNLIRLGQGSIQALIVLAVMAFSAYAMINLSLYSDVFLPIVEPLSVEFSQAKSQNIIALLFDKAQQQNLKLIFAIALFVTVLVFALKNKIFREYRYLLSSFGIGSIIFLGFLLTGGEFGQVLIEESEFMDEPLRGLATQSFSFAAPMADTIYALWYREGINVITFGVVAVIGLPLGAFISSIFRKEFKPSGITSIKYLTKNIIGAVLVGIGSVLAMGCSIGHGLTGASTMALGSFVTLMFIFLGAFMALKFKL